MPEPVIHIDTVRWELNTPSVDKARYWQEEVSRFTHATLPGIIQQSVNERVGEEEHIVIPRIELELPALQHPEDIALLFEEKWKEAIEELLLIQTLAKQGVISRSEEKRFTVAEQLLHYLRTGELVWYSDKALFADSAALQTMLITEQPAVLSAMIAEAFEQTGTFRRLVTYFREDQLFALLHRSGLLSVTTEEWYWLTDKWMEQQLPGWQKHPYRLLILFSLIKISVGKSPLITDDKNLLQQWWQEVSRKNYFTFEETARLHETAKRLIAQRKAEVPAIKTLREEKEALLAEILTGISVTTTGKDEEQQLPEVKKEAEAQQDENTKSYFIVNAGIILLYPYCKAWFREAGLLNEENNFSNPEQRMNACRLLQATAFGTIDFKEYHLVLNKVLCGYPLQSAVYGETTTPEEVLTQADERIGIVISHWDKIRATSVEGFRNSFLLRNGKLTIEDDHYLLRVERKAWDVLLDTYPHPKNIIKLPWMDKPLYTEW